MNQASVLIIEDNVLIAESLKMMLLTMDFEVSAIFRSGTEAISHFKEHPVDIVIMDIHLANNTNGIDTSKELQKWRKVPVIFITDDRNDYLRKKAIYETNAIYYINKPFSPINISTALDLALKVIKTEREDPFITQTQQAFPDRIFLKSSHGGYQKILISELLWLRADSSYCDFVCLRQGNSERKIYTFSENLSYYERKLSFAIEMVRVHRSYIVNINHIEKILENRFWIQGEEIPVGEKYRAKFKEHIKFV